MSLKSSKLFKYTVHYQIKLYETNIYWRRYYLSTKTKHHVNLLYARKKVKVKVTTVYRRKLLPNQVPCVLQYWPMKAFGMVILSHMRSRISRPESGLAIALTTVAMSVLMVRFRSSNPAHREVDDENVTH